MHWYRPSYWVNWTMDLCYVLHGYNDTWDCAWLSFSSPSSCQYYNMLNILNTWQPLLPWHCCWGLILCQGLCLLFIQYLFSISPHFSQIILSLNMNWIWKAMMMLMHWVNWGWLLLHYDSGCHSSWIIQMLLLQTLC